MCVWAAVFPTKSIKTSYHWSYDNQEQQMMEDNFFTTNCYDSKAETFERQVIDWEE